MSYKYKARAINDASHCCLTSYFWRASALPLASIQHGIPEFSPTASLFYDHRRKVHDYARRITSRLLLVSNLEIRENVHNRL
jgi:hypothetical protein